MELQKTILALTNSLKGENKHLTQSEQKVVEVKYASKRFGAMDADELLIVSKKLLLTINVIAGWVLPIDPFLGILEEQFCKKMTEGYSNLNADEIEYAFRNRGMEVKDWGRELNLTLIDEVLAPYIAQRVEISKIEENLSPNELVEAKKDLTDEEWEEWLGDIAKYELDMIPVLAYDYLLKKQRISPTGKEKNEYMDKCASRQLALLDPDKNPIEHREFVAMKNKGVFEGVFFDKLVVMSKRMIVRDYFKNQANGGNL